MIPAFAATSAGEPTTALQVYVATEDIVPLLTLRRERSEQEYMDFMRARFMPSA